MPGMSISGVSVAIMAAGGVAVWSGLNNTGMLDTLRALSKGQAPTPNRNPPWQDLNLGGGTTTDFKNLGGSSGDAVVTEARKWIGKSKYVYGGCHGCTPCHPGQGVDCSSFVTWVMKAVNLYDGKCSMVAGSSMLAWGRKVPNASRQAGDVVLWPGSHCGIVESMDTMINAACTACGPVMRSNYSKRSGWVTLRAPKLMDTSTNGLVQNSTVTGTIQGNP